MGSCSRDMCEEKLYDSIVHYRWTEGNFSIQVSRITFSRLIAYSKKGESDDEIISRLLDEIEENRK